MANHRAAQFKYTQLSLEQHCVQTVSIVNTASPIQPTAVDPAQSTVMCVGVESDMEEPQICQLELTHAFSTSWLNWAKASTSKVTTISGVSEESRDQAHWFLTTRAPL